MHVATSTNVFSNRTFINIQFFLKMIQLERSEVIPREKRDFSLAHAPLKGHWWGKNQKNKRCIALSILELPHKQPPLTLVALDQALRVHTWKND